VPQIVEANEWHTGILEYWPEPASRHVAVIERIAYRIGKEQIVIIPSLAKR
jgi:hypothetical protein